MVNPCCQDKGAEALLTIRNHKLRNWFNEVKVKVRVKSGGFFVFWIVVEKGH